MAFVVRPLVVLLCLLAGPGLVVGRAGAQEAAPSAQVITTFHAALTAAMQQADKLKFEGRVAVIDAAVQRAFDIPAITRRVVGAQWNKLSDEDKAKIGTAFRQLAVATLASQFKSYSGETFEIGETTPRTDGVVLQHSTLVFTDGDPPVHFDYLLHDGEQGWRVIDIFLDGKVSEVERRREEFVSVLRASGVEGLLAAIDRKVANLART